MGLRERGGALRYVFGGEPLECFHMFCGYQSLRQRSGIVIANGGSKPCAERVNTLGAVRAEPRNFGIDRRSQLRTLLRLFGSVDAKGCAEIILRPAAAVGEIPQVRKRGIAAFDLQLDAVRQL